MNRGIPKFKVIRNSDKDKIENIGKDLRIIIDKIEDVLESDEINRISTNQNSKPN